MCSDMQNGSDLLRRQNRRDKANVTLCTPELGLCFQKDWESGGYYVKIQSELGSVEGSSGRADVHTLAYVSLCACTYVCLYMQFTASRGLF